VRSSENSKSSRAGARSVIRMILVTGATGTVGSNVVRELLAQGEQVRAMTRNPAAQASRAGLDVVFGDFDKPETLEHAADGVDALFLLSAPGPTLPAHDLAMLAAARAKGISRIVKLSAIGTPDDDAPTRLGGWHQPGEAAARASGLAWTILRPTTFASNSLQWAGAIRAGRPAPNMFSTGAQGIVDPADVAAVAAAALTGAGHVAKTYTLTGPELLSVPDQVRQLGEMLRRPTSTVEVELEVARHEMIAAGMPSEFADTAIAGAAYVRDGSNAIVTEDVARILGRPARSFRAWAEEHRRAFG
jgi:uncharacterized protein YbjT (DUF2867 family)